MQYWAFRCWSPFQRKQDLEEDPGEWNPQWALAWQKACPHARTGLPILLMDCSSWGPRCCYQNDLRQWLSSSPSGCLSLKTCEHIFPLSVQSLDTAKKPLPGPSPWRYSFLHPYRIGGLLPVSLEGSLSDIFLSSYQTSGLPLSPYTKVSSPPATRPPEKRLGSYCLTSERNWKPQFPQPSPPATRPPEKRLGSYCLTSERNWKPQFPQPSPPATRPPERRLGSYCLTSEKNWKPRFPVGFLPLEAPVGTVVYTFPQNRLAKTYKSLEHSEPTWISSPHSLGKAAPCL